jgi:hypothetical protein
VRVILQKRDHQYAKDRHTREYIKKSGGTPGPKFKTGLRATQIAGLFKERSHIAVPEYVDTLKEEQAGSHKAADNHEWNHRIIAGNLQASFRDLGEALQHRQSRVFGRRTGKAISHNIQLVLPRPKLSTRRLAV